jgi:uncharacterized protein
MTNARDTTLSMMQRYIAAAQAADWQEAFACFAENIVLHVPGRSPLAGTHRGHDAVTRYLQTVIAGVQDVEVELVDMLTSDDRVALIVHERFVSQGRVIEIQRANVYRVLDGSIVEIRIFEANQYEADALIASTSQTEASLEQP